MTVRRAGKFCGDPAAADIYELVAGHRRRAAAQKLGWETIQAIVVEADDDQAERMLVAENFARRDLSPLEMADTAAALVERHGAAEAGRICGKSERWAQRMAYISGRLTEDWRTVARAWGLSQASLQALCRGTADTQRDTLDALLRDCKAKSLGEFLALRGKREIYELDNGGDPDSLYPECDGNFIRNIPWIVCECGDCDGCQDRTDAMPPDLFDGGNGDEDPECLGDKCFKAKMKEWLAGRGLREWSRKLGREVRVQPKGVDSWQGANEEHPNHPVPVLITGGYPQGCVRWFSESSLAPKRSAKPEKVWPTPQELRETAYCETVRDWLAEWAPTPADLMRAAAALLTGVALDGKAEWDSAKRMSIAKAMTARDAEAAVLAAIVKFPGTRGYSIGNGQNGPTKYQLDFWKTVESFVTGGDAKCVDGLKAEAAALAERRIADVAEAKKGAKAKARKAKGGAK